MIRSHGIWRTAGILLLGLPASGCLPHRESALPPVVTPGPAPDRPIEPPSDAIILFDGSDLSKWTDEAGGETHWEVKDGIATTGSGDIQTKQAFGDAQIHVEWAAPEKIEGSGQGRGNSGVFIQDRYEIQILDSFNNPTYPDGQAGAVYKQHPPLVNASRAPGEWQTFDIVFRAPRFDGDGNLLDAARVTALHNGIVIHDNVEIKGTTTHWGWPRYRAHQPEQPLRLQDHGDAVRFRSIWVRPL